MVIEQLPNSIFLQSVVNLYNNCNAWHEWLEEVKQYEPFDMKPRSMLLGYLTGGLLVLVILPALIWLLTLLANRAIYIPLFANEFLQWLAVSLLLVTGFSFGISANVYQNIVGEGGPLEIGDVEISPKTRHLVVSGPYRYTRNPMLFGTFLIYTALAVALNSLAALVFVSLFALFMLTVVVKKEEERLLRDFGQEYLDYRKKTSLILPWWPKKMKN